MSPSLRSRLLSMLPRLAERLRDALRAASESRPPGGAAEPWHHGAALRPVPVRTSERRERREPRGL